MKTLILTAAFVVTASVMFAQQPEQKKVQKNDTSVSLTDKDVEVAFLRNSQNTVKMMLAKDPGDVVKVKVYEGNSLLYVKRIKKPATAKITYDISQFPDGEYTFQLEKDKEVIHSEEISKGDKVLAGK